MTSTHSVTPTRAQLDAFRSSFTGDVITPDAAGYDDARRVWNAMFDRRPAMVVRPSNVDDVAAAVRFGRELDLEIAVRGGGHSAVGHSTTDGGLVIDLARMNAVSVDPGRRLARTGGGALLGTLDIAGQEHGLVCPVGVVGHTGVAGLTLGGGVGRLQRRFGLTIDSLRAVELVTADGRVVRASADEEPELFWGLRGAGANFGVATSLELELHPFSGTLHRGVHIHPATDIQELWPIFREFVATAPDSISIIFTVARNDSADDYPDAVVGAPIVVISYNHSGAGEDVEHEIAPLLDGPKPASVTATSEPYVTAQKSSDLSLAWGSRTAILGGYVADCSPAVLDAFVAHVERVPGDASISVTAFGGAIARMPDDAMAFTGRTVPFDVSPDTGWSDPDLDEANMKWVRQAMAIVEPDRLPGRYINELSDAGPEVTHASYGAAKLERLRALKRAWDPTNVFHLNHNIDPATD
ncbi:MAG TPA: FAD-binding oxidoreductase [Candidatus Limnocylindrales bacterium]|jgi:FAD/FMN-containing dehydrogenase|nr:FAD-binding oxidoreductase [Candidatus Limnocylindrales bacterium]